jgi:hypothetical protein
MTMQLKHYALTAVTSAAFALTAQAQTTLSTDTPQPVPQAVEIVPSTTLPADQVIVRPPQDSTIIIVSPRSSYDLSTNPGVGAPASRDEVKAHTVAEMKAGNIPRGEQSTPIQGMKNESSGAEAPWHNK